QTGEEPQHGVLPRTQPADLADPGLARRSFSPIGGWGRHAGALEGHEPGPARSETAGQDATAVAQTYEVPRRRTAVHFRHARALRCELDAPGRGDIWHGAGGQDVVIRRVHLCSVRTVASEKGRAVAEFR